MKDLTGQRFGKLVVVKHDDSSTTRHPKWICQCDCGSTKSIHASALTGGLTNSCGCLRRETMDSKTRLQKYDSVKWNGIHCFIFGSTNGRLVLRNIDGDLSTPNLSINSKEVKYVHRNKKLLIQNIKI